MTTVNLGMTLPTVGADADVWGNELNADLNLIDARLPKIAFSAYPNTTQTFANTTATKVTMGAEEYDVGAYFDSATNYRFTPLVAGYYLFTARLQFVAMSASGATAILELYKNGSSYKRLAQVQNPASGTLVAIVHGSALIYLNGSTDYVELYATQTNGASLDTAGGTNNAINFLQGVLQFPA